MNNRMGSLVPIVPADVMGVIRCMPVIVPKLFTGISSELI
jgi:hypothetical protein